MPESRRPRLIMESARRGVFALKRIHIVGRKNTGKTSLVVELIAELRRRGLTVGTIKHTPHDHEVDLPGKDSFRHFEAGAVPAALVTASKTAIFLPPIKATSEASGEPASGEPASGASASGDPSSADAASGGTTVARPSSPDSLYVQLAPYFDACDLVLVEGNLDAKGIKVEIWRPVSTEPPICVADTGKADGKDAGDSDESEAGITVNEKRIGGSGAAGIAALICDDPPASVPVPTWPRSDVPAIVDRLLELAGTGGDGELP